MFRLVSTEPSSGWAQSEDGAVETSPKHVAVRYDVKYFLIIIASYWGLTNFSRHCAKFIAHGDLAFEIYPPHSAVIASRQATGWLIRKLPPISIEWVAVWDPESVWTLRRRVKIFCLIRESKRSSLDARRIA